MSVKIMGLVWDAEIDREQKYVLLAYADHADHDGKNIFPAVKTIAKKTGYSERSIQRITRLLEDNGYLVKYGKGIKGTNKYKIPVLGDKIAPLTKFQGDKNDTEGVTPVSPKPSIKPSLKDKDKSLSSPPPKEKSEYVKSMERLEKAFAQSRGCSLPDWEKSPRAANKRWRMPLARVWRENDRDTRLLERGVRAVTSRMVKDRLTFDAPDGIEKSLRSWLIDEKRKNGRTNKPTDETEYYITDDEAAKAIINSKTG